MSRKRDVYEAGEINMGNEIEQRKSQRWSAIMAVCILVGLLIMMPIGGGLADYMNSANAPEAEASRYALASAQSGVTVDIDADAFKATGGYASYYVTQNASGYTNYYNVTHSAGVISVATTDTNGLNNISSAANYTANVSWTQMHPYFLIYFDYTAKSAYADNVVRIRLYVANLYVSAHAYARTITLSAGGQTFYTVTIAQTDTDNYIDENITINANDLRRAIIEAGINSYFTLKVTAQDKTLSIANSAIYTYNVAKLFSRDDALYIVGALSCAIMLAGVFLVQPRYSLPIGRKAPPRGGY